MKKGKYSKFKKTIIIIIVIIISLLSLFLIYLNKVVGPVVIEFSQTRVRSLTQKAVSSAIYDIIKDNTIYDSLITIQRNNNGNINMISSNALQINMLTREITKKAQYNLENVGCKGIEIPIGSFSGMPIFVGRGPSVNIKLIPIGSINSSFVSEFVSAGINQTNHKIYLHVKSNVNVLLPTASKSVSTDTQMLICESIIIGEIPETYLMSKELGDMMDLVPN